MKKPILQLATTALMFVFTLASYAQPIGVFQFRKVAPENVSEFIERETKYWSKIAQKAVDDGKLINWVLLQKVGGYDLPNSSNFVFLNTVEDIDMDMGSIWDPAKMFPDVPADQISTWDMSTTSHQIYVQNSPIIAAANATDEDMNYVKFNFWKSPSPGEFYDLEHKHWAPFIKEALNKDGVSQVGWSNGVILSPRGPEIPANSISYDFYKTLEDALRPSWPEETVFPEEGLSEIMEMAETRSEVIYRIVQAVTADN